MTSSAPGWVLGIDPGAKATGVVVRTGVELAYGTTAVRDKGETVEQYAAGVVNLVAGITERFTELLENYPLVAIEGVLAPNVWNNGDRVVLHPQFVMDTCTVAGHVAGWATAERLEVNWVRPGHNGQDSWAPTQQICARIEAKAPARTDSGTCAARGMWPELHC